MTGSRKYRFALYCLAALVAGLAACALTSRISVELFKEYVFGLFLLISGFGVPNGIEHIAGAVKARREAAK